MAETTNHYTFGSGSLASQRLRRLAEAYDPETRLLLADVEPGLGLALDLGCGPGWSTERLHALARPARTVGLDGASSYIDEARTRAPRGIEYQVHDVMVTPFPCDAADVLLCRFLLTHLARPQAALRAWATVARPGARLFVHETARLTSDHPTLELYYACVAKMQSHYGQSLHVGADLEAHFDPRQWRIVRSEVIARAKPARVMAELHLMNLRTWRSDPFARGHFAPQTLQELERDLERIAAGHETAADVRNACRHVVAERLE
jgi:trans-aconitate 2-methyltransferase